MYTIVDIVLAGIVLALALGIILTLLLVKPHQTVNTVYAIRECIYQYLKSGLVQYLLQEYEQKEIKSQELADALRTIVQSCGGSGFMLVNSSGIVVCKFPDTLSCTDTVQINIPITQIEDREQISNVYTLIVCVS